MPIADVSFAWDEWNVKGYYMFVEPTEFERLDVLTNKANTALTIAIGEWNCARFAKFERDAAPRQFLQACWAGIVHPAYCVYTETVDDEWRGSVRAPLAITIAIANDALFCLADDSHVATRVCWMSNLARHVLADAVPFEEWREVAIRRLEQYHTKSAEAHLDPDDLFAEVEWQGRPVPREALDPAFAYEPSMAPRLLDGFLRALVPTSNRFLRSPDELAEVANLPAAPYRYWVPDAQERNG